MFWGAKGAAGAAEGLAGRLMGLTSMRNGKAGDEKSAADVCVCLFKVEKREEHGPETSLQIGRLLHTSETFMKSFLTVSLSFSCLYICSHSRFFIRERLKRQMCTSADFFFPLKNLFFMVNDYSHREDAPQVWKKIFTKLPWSKAMMKKRQHRLSLSPRLSLWAFCCLPFFGADLWCRIQTQTCTHVWI